MKSQIGDVIEIPGKEGIWIVEQARMDGGGTGMGAHDVFPDVWTVTARQLDGTLPYGEPFEFSQESGYRNEIKDVKTLEKRRVVIWVRPETVQFRQ